MDTCLICDKPHKCRRVYFKSKEHSDLNLICVDFMPYHRECKKAYDKVEKMRKKLITSQQEVMRAEQDLMSAEFELFLINDKYY